jgi:hypothetical protein
MNGEREDIAALKERAIDHEAQAAATAAEAERLKAEIQRRLRAMEGAV